jgi:hypothetical protein
MLQLAAAAHSEHGTNGLGTVSRSVKHFHKVRAGEVLPLLDNSGAHGLTGQGVRDERDATVNPAESLTAKRKRVEANGDRR